VHAKRHAHEVQENFNLKNRSSEGIVPAKKDRQVIKPGVGRNDLDTGLTDS